MQTHPLFNVSLVDALNKTINMFLLEHALNNYDTPNIYFGFFFNNGDRHIYRFSRLVNDRIYFKDSTDEEDVYMDLSHDSIRSIKFMYSEMIFNDIDILGTLDSVVIINQYRPTEFIGRVNVKNYTPIPGTKFINWS